MRPAPVASPVRHEDLFVSRYADLLTWALHLTGRDHERAEDLVQEAFVHFVLAEPNLSAIENLDGYLYCTLRNLHISGLRRLGRSPDHTRSIVEFDTAELGLASQPCNQVEAQDELREICRYACERKQTSKAASVLILRFFHGYYPSEIAALTRMSRETLAVLLNSSRSEARLVLAEPSRLRFMRATVHSVSRAFFRRTNRDFVHELRQVVFRSREGQCPPVETLRATYADTQAGSLDVRLLSHIVSCRPCLDRVNDILGLPRLDDRHPSDMLGPDPRNRGGRGRGASPPPVGAGIRRAKQKLRDVLEHEPRELRLAVNGVIRGWQALEGARTELSLVLEPTESVDFVELLSDQGQRLLLLNVTPPPAGAFEQLGTVTLSEGRRLDVVVRFGGDLPHVQVIWTDPTAHATAMPERRQTADVPLVGVFPRLVRDEPEGPPRSLWTRWLRPFPALATALTLAVAGSILYRTMTPASAAELLATTGRAEQQAFSGPATSVHRVIDVEQRVLPDGVPIRQRVDVWRSAQRGMIVRRLYDANQRLIAGEWERADGSRTTYRLGAAPAESNARLAGAIRTENAWQWEPSAEAFSTLAVSGKAARVTRTADAYILTFRPSQPTASGIVEVSLRISRTAGRAVEQIIVFRVGDRLVETRSREGTFEQVASERVPARTFEPDPALTSIPAAPEPMVVPSTPNPVEKPIAPRLDDVDLERLELTVWYRLHGAGVWPGERAQVTRTERAVVVHARVASEARAQVLRARLARERELQLDITVADQSGGASASTETQGAVWARSRIEQYFDTQLRGTATRTVSDQEIAAVAARLTDWVVERSRVRLEHARALAAAAERWTPNMFARLGPDAAAMWYTMLRDHANTLQQTTESLRLQLQPIFFPELALDASAPLDASTTPPDSPRDLAKEVLDAVIRQDRIIDRFFAPAAPAIDAARPNLELELRELGRSLREVERQVTRFTLPFSL